MYCFLYETTGQDYRTSTGTFPVLRKKQIFPSGLAVIKQTCLQAYYAVSINRINNILFLKHNIINHQPLAAPLFCGFPLIMRRGVTNSWVTQPSVRHGTRPL